MKRYIPLIIALLVIIAIVIIGIIVIKPTNPAPEPITDGTPRPVTLQGESTCLPHKDTSAPVTLECALGIQTGANVFYALDLSDVPESMNVSGRIQVKGLMTPVEALSSDQWQKYNMKGIVKASEVIELEPEMNK